MVEMPQPHDPGEGFEAIYDAWNRLVELIDEGTQSTVATYRWDGLGRRISETSGGETRYFYHSLHHQILEERVDGTSGGDVQVQYVWCLRYLDALIARDRDTTGNAELDERLYALQDANFNVTALVDTSGDVVERYRYSPYGERTVLNDDFSMHADAIHGAFAWVIGHQGLMRDIESGLVYNRARMLHPGLGRFVQRDPLDSNRVAGGYQDGLHLYQYVRSIPIYLLDPSGGWAIVPRPAAKPIGIGLGKLAGFAIGAAITWEASRELDRNWDRIQQNNRRVPVGQKCDNATLTSLLAKKDAACGKAFSCREGMCCRQAMANEALALACAEARRILQNTCYTPQHSEWAGHMQAKNEARRAASNCRRIVSENKCVD